MLDENCCCLTLTPGRVQQSVALIQPAHPLRHHENNVFSSSENKDTRSKYPKQMLFNFKTEVLPPQT